MKFWTIPCVLGLFACGAKQSGNGANHNGDPADFATLPDRKTSAVLAGPLCETSECKCRDRSAPGNGGAGDPENGKRFEVKLGPSSHELWVSVGGNLFYKSAERSEACFYVDLPTGENAVAFRASNKSGVSAAIEISEYSSKSQSWYNTFSFNCGSPGACGYDDLDETKRRFATYTKGLHDPCGSVRITKINWNSAEARDQQHPNELALTMVMSVYKFAPYKPSGSECSTGGQTAAEAEGAAN